MPLAEALASGTPAVGSRVGAIPEVIGHEAALFDPDDVDDMARVITRVLRDADLATAIVEQAPRWTWSDVADRVEVLTIGVDGEFYSPADASACRVQLRESAGVGGDGSITGETTASRAASCLGSTSRASLEGAGSAPAVFSPRPLA